MKESILQNSKQEPGPTLHTLPDNSTRPIYRQIQELILQKIKGGVWEPGKKIPSENELVKELGVSRMTINRALRELNQHGFLERVPGVGTFVKKPPRHASLINIQNIADEIKARGKRHKAEVWLSERAAVAPDYAQLMGVSREDELFHMLIVHLENDIPIQIEDRYVNPSSAPGFLDADFSMITPTQYLMDLYSPDEIEHTVSAILPEKNIADMLSITTDEPCLKLSRRTWVGGEVVTYVDFIYPSSRYDLKARYATDTFRP